MKKTLIICKFYPSPPNIGTSIRTLNFVRYFRSIGTVDIAYSEMLSSGINGNSIFSNEYPLKIKEEHNFKELFLKWINIWNRPLEVLRYQEESEKQLSYLLENNKYDYILVRYVINTWSLFQITTRDPKRIIVDFDDILSGSLYETCIASEQKWNRKKRLMLNRFYLRKYEKKCLNFGAAIFCSEKDKLKIVANENVKNNAFVVPNIYSDKTFENHDFGDGFHKDNALLFVGLLDYGPNIQGLKWFIECIFSDFKRRYPDATLSVVGRFPGNELKILAEKTRGVRLYADAPDTRIHYQKCRVVVVPLLTGGGTRIKILEAALAQRPILSTPLGAEGLSFHDNQNILLFEQAESFLLQYAKLFDQKKYHDLVHKAKSTVSKNYSDGEFNHIMGTVLKSIDLANQEMEYKKAEGTNE